MSRWPAIAALGVMAWPASFLIGAGFVGFVESWKYGHLLRDTCEPGRAPSDEVKHCLTPVTALRPEDAWQVIGIILLALGLWWTGWYLQLRSARKLAGAPSALPVSSLLLALWFFGALASCTAWVANIHTFM